VAQLFSLGIIRTFEDFMHTENIKMDLGEALIHLQALVAELRDGKIQSHDEPALAVQLKEIMEHTHHAWNCKDMTSDQMKSGK
jgi:hypothetical protein